MEQLSKLNTSSLFNILKEPLVANNTSFKIPEPQLLGTGRLWSAKAKGFHYWSPKFNSKDSAFVFVLDCLTYS